MDMATIQNQYTQHHQSTIDAHSNNPNQSHSIIKKSMHIAPDFLLVGLLSPKNFTLRNMPPTLSFCAEPKGEVAESIIQKINLALRAE
ncbi:MAG: hypothetical protein QF385_04135 [SAR324 cluster bacterium]|nr:hypothetical protein [SAR324 cluster bacterium]